MPQLASPPSPAHAIREPPLSSLSTVTGTLSATTIVAWVPGAAAVSPRLPSAPVRHSCWRDEIDAVKVAAGDSEGVEIEGYDYKGRELGPVHPVLMLTS